VFGGPNLLCSLPCPSREYLAGDYRRGASVHIRNAHWWWYDKNMREERAFGQSSPRPVRCCVGRVGAVDSGRSHTADGGNASCCTSERRSCRLQQRVEYLQRCQPGLWPVLPVAKFIEVIRLSEQPSTKFPLMNIFQPCVCALTAFGFKRRPFRSDAHKWCAINANKNRHRPLAFARL